MQSVRANRAKVGAEQTFGLVEEKKKKSEKNKSLKIGHNCCARRAGSTTQPADLVEIKFPFPRPSPLSAAGERKEVLWAVGGHSSPGTRPGTRRP